MVAGAQVLGLHRDPSNWTVLPSWERRLRKRLWWAVVVAETWIAFGQEMATHINLEEGDVPLPAAEDLGESLSLCNDSDAIDSCFYQLVLLTIILWDIRTAFYSLSATKHMADDLAASLLIAQPLRAKLTEWHARLPPDLTLQRPSQTTNSSKMGGAISTVLPT